MGSLLLGVDIGTSCVKASVLDPDIGRVVATGTAEHPLHFPQPGYAEQQAEDYWRAVCASIAECLQHVRGENIGGLAFSGLGGCFLGIDAEGNPVIPSMIWADTRAEHLTDTIAEMVSRELIQEITGNRIAPIFIDQKAIWLKENDPERFNRIDSFLTPNGYCVFRMTGERVMNTGDACFFYPFDYRAECWRTEISDALGIPADKYPQLVRPWEQVGVISGKAAAETGLKAGTPVAGGGPDISAAALGCGVTRLGQAFYSMGTASNLGVVIPTAEPVHEYRLIKFGHVVPGQTMLDAPMAYTGAALRWFRDTFAGNETLLAERVGMSVYELIANQAQKVNPGADGVMFHPFLGNVLAPHWNPNATGTFFGMRASSTRAHMIRALMEGVAFDANSNIAVMREAGVPIDRMVMNGGPTQSRLWMRVISDVTGLSLEIPDFEASGSLGCAILAGVAAGVINEVTDGIQFVHIRESIEPIAANHALYTEMFVIWREVYECLLPQYDAHRAFLQRHHMK